MRGHEMPCMTGALAPTRQGEVLAWGINDFGQLGNGSTFYETSPTQVRRAWPQGPSAPAAFRLNVRAGINILLCMPTHDLLTAVRRWYTRRHPCAGPYGSDRHV